MSKEMERWEKKEGIKSLRKIGIKSGQTILDFGARVGHYSIPAARIVGREGIVYALDKDNYSLNELKRKMTEQRLENIITIKANDNMKIRLENNSIDVVLLYDVLHLIDDREKLYKEVYKVLQEDGLFSVYPKHNKTDSPGWGLKNMTPKDIKNEIENYDFHFEEEYCILLSHDESINQGCVLNFRKL